MTGSVCRGGALKRSAGSAPRQSGWTSCRPRPSPSRPTWRTRAVRGRRRLRRHSARRSATRPAAHHESDFIATNVVGTQNALDAAVGYPVVTRRPPPHHHQAGQGGEGRADRVARRALRTAGGRRIPTTRSIAPGRVRPLQAGGGAAVRQSGGGRPAAPSSGSRAASRRRRRCRAGALPDTRCRRRRRSTPNFWPMSCWGRVAPVDALVGHLRALTRSRARRNCVPTFRAFPWDRSPPPPMTRLATLREQRPRLAALYAQLGRGVAGVDRARDSSRAAGALRHAGVTFDARGGARGEAGTGTQLVTFRKGAAPRCSHTALPGPVSFFESHVLQPEVRFFALFDPAPNSSPVRCPPADG